MKSMSDTNNLCNIEIKVLYGFQTVDKDSNYINKITISAFMNQIFIKFSTFIEAQSLFHNTT